MVSWIAVLGIMQLGTRCSLQTSLLRLRTKLCRNKFRVLEIDKTSIPNGGFNGDLVGGCNPIEKY